MLHCENEQPMELLITENQNKIENLMTLEGPTQHKKRTAVKMSNSLNGRTFS